MEVSIQERSRLHSFPVNTRHWTKGVLVWWWLTVYVWGLSTSIRHQIKLAIHLDITFQTEKNDLTLNSSVLRHNRGKRPRRFICAFHTSCHRSKQDKHHSCDSRLGDLSVENLYPELEKANGNYCKKQYGVKRNGLHIYFRRMIPRQECRKRSQYNIVTFLSLF